MEEARSQNAARREQINLPRTEQEPVVSESDVRRLDLTYWQVRHQYIEDVYREMMSPRPLVDREGS
jgi:hypothetical protein